MSSLDSGGRKRTRDKDGKQRMLLEAAAEVFAECGYDEAATKEIARRANCSESLIFRYFGDKQGIFEKVVTHRLDEDTQEERDLVASHPDTIEEFLAHFFRSRRARSAFFAFNRWDVVAARALSDEGFAFRTLRGNHRRRVAAIAGGIKFYQQAGQVSADIDAALLAEVIADIESFLNILGPRLFGTSGRRGRQLVDMTIRCLLGGISTSSMEPLSSDWCDTLETGGHPRKS